MRRSRTVATAILFLVVPLLAASPASATFHEISIREVYPGSAASPGSEYVELQMWASGQNFVAGHLLRTYGPTGAVVQSNPFGSDVPRGANQSTILLATPEAEAQFGIAADGALSPSGQLDPVGGAVCWESLDCVSWGGFGGSLPSPPGPPAAAGGVPDGMALRRTISPGCATLLEPTDDHDNSAADLAAVFPGPRPNSLEPGERPCDGSGSPQGPGADVRGAPQTRLGRRPPHKTRDRTPTFRFGADEAESSFQCRLDGKPYRPCRSPFTTRRLALGRHAFRVRARDASGTLDPTPASYRFEVIARNR